MRITIRGVCLVLLALFSIGASVTAAQTPPSAREIADYQGLHAAAAKGDVAALRASIRDRGDLNARDGHGRTAVHIAAHGGHYDVVRELAKAGADMTAQDSRRYDIITIAAVRDDATMVELAVALGADPRAITSPYDGTALIAAAHLGHHAVVKALIVAKAPLDHVNNLGWTAVIEAVILGDGGARHQATLKALIDAGANTRLADRSGATPLDHAKSRGFSAMLKMLEAARR